MLIRMQVGRVRNQNAFTSGFSHTSHTVTLNCYVCHVVVSYLNVHLTQREPPPNFIQTKHQKHSQSHTELIAREQNKKPFVNKSRLENDFFFFFFVPIILKKKSMIILLFFSSLISLSLLPSIENSANYGSLRIRNFEGFMKIICLHYLLDTVWLLFTITISINRYCGIIPK